MARNSKLTDKQWAEIERRLTSGESTSSLAREFGVGKSTISERFSERTKRVKATAGLLVKAESAFQSLSVSEQISARSLADDLKSISEHLAGAAKFGAMTAHRLNYIANSKIDQLDETASLEENSETLKSVLAFSKTANASAEIGLNLLRANKETVEGLNRDADKPEPKQIVFTVEDASA